ncbi:UDP-2,4-diacetamido-2,4,6-trideoxy-beta-L-altropyranose hydrolase [Limnohabitans sp. DCL3]|uniref:UDP-2,4-diacetamido-2,4, 6-trideoxy-beta-L-altropyranose hydrolase n=1 Tax=Limnohabitans sp. DCL3 TaxID=3374103 RepID=UPI003A849038
MQKLHWLLQVYKSGNLLRFDMNIAFRTDASLQIGTGHVMRCLTLANAMRARGAQTTFICRPQLGDMLCWISQQGHAVKVLSPVDDGFTTPFAPTHAKWLGTDWVNDANQTKAALGDQFMDWLVVDHYALDERWEIALSQHTRRMMVIDDLADRAHNCDLLLDQNLGHTPQDYARLLCSYTQTFIGPAYALIRPEFTQWRAYSLQRRDQVLMKNLLITMGGVDLNNATGRVLDALFNCELPDDLRITVVMGQKAPWLAQVQEQAMYMPYQTNVLTGVSNMAQLMAQSDLCIGAAGSTAWERCCLGLPTIQVVLAMNQIGINAALELNRSVKTVCIEKLKVDLPPIIDSDNFSELSKNSAKVCDGRGTIKIVQWLEKVKNEDNSAL